nr:hypothetical protein [uncultured Desulfobacter sp.]
MKKLSVTTILILCFGIITCLTSVASANLVSIVFDDIYESGIKVRSIQFDFIADVYPFLSDDNDLWAEADFTTSKGEAITWNNTVSNNWSVEEGAIDYDSETGITRATGGVIYYFGSSENDGYALHDGIVGTYESSVEFSVDLDSIQVFKWDDTANSIAFTVSESYSGLDQIVTISASNVPIPSSIVLLGVGICSLLGLSRKKSVR